MLRQEEENVCGEGEKLMNWLSRYRDAVSLVVAMLAFIGILWWLIAVTATIKG